jgi:putative ABC transport system permease protein
MSVLISVLGLFGITFLMLNARIKEIGIRKINGAKISDIVTMLNAAFIKWVIAAFIIATPISWFIMQKWLDNFAYKTNLSWWIYTLSGMAALGIALLTVSLQSWRAASRNPVETLRYE